jgi:hypothetical protein
MAKFYNEDGFTVDQKSVKCKGCARKFLAPAVDSGRQEISPDIHSSGSFALICPFCMTHAVYATRDLE